MKNKKNILVLILVGLGLLTLLLPIYQKIKINNQNNIEIRAFEEQTDKTPNFTQKVEKYNKETNEKFNTSADNSYVDAVDKGQVIALIYIPKIDQLLPIRYGTDDKTLANGLGILENTHMPTGGLGNNSVVTGHRGTATADLLKHIDKLEVGDPIYIKLPTRILKYETKSGAIVEPNDRELITIEEDKDKFTLITCHPYLINNKRLIYGLERAYLTESDKSFLKVFKDSDKLFSESVDMDKERIKIEQKYYPETISTDELPTTNEQEKRIIEDKGIMSFIKEHTTYVYISLFLILLLIAIVLRKVFQK